MAQKLSIQLALEGAEEIKRQLADIGDAGQKAFGEIVQAAKKTGSFAALDPSVVAEKIKKFGVEGPAAINKINEAVKAAGRFEELVQGLKLVETALNKTGIAGKALVLAFGPLGAAVTILATLFGVALVGAVVKAGEAIAAIDAQAIKLGSTFEAFSKVREGLLRAGVVGDNIAQGFQHLQGVIDKVSLARVEKALTTAQKNIAAGWPPQTEQLEIMRAAANSTSPALAEVGRKALEAIGQPIDDRVTPLLDAMIRSAGSAVAVIPNLTAELTGLRSAGERTRLVSDLLDRIAVESGGAVQAMEPLLRVLEQMPPGVERNAQATRLFGDAMGTQVAQLLNLGTSISDIIEKSKGMAQSQADAGNKIVQTFNQAKGALTGFDQMWGAIATSGAAALGKINSGMDTLIGKLQEAVKLMGQLNAGGGGGGALPAHAAGGLIGGSGSGTSDSNLAWVSRGEHIMPARAVSQPGVMAFLEALRRSGGDLRSVLGRIPRFAEGGPIAAHRDLGTVRLVMPDGVMVSGLADAKIVQALGRAAAMAQVRSGGRKPSRYS